MGRARAAAVAAAFLLATGAGVRAWQESPVSPARGHAAVAAQGLAPMPDGEAVWRVTYQPAGSAEAAFVQADPGFVVADDGALLVEDDAARRALLLPGEAAFSPAAPQRVGAAGGPQAGFFEIDLAGAADAGPEGGEVSYASPPFAAPAGERSLKLLRDALAAGESAVVAATDAPALVLALSGSVEVAAADGSSAALDAGMAGSFSGEVTVTATGAGPSTFVAALILPGLDIPAVESAPAVADAGQGAAIAAEVFACPEGVKTADASPDTCAADAAAMTLDLVALDGEQPRDLGGPQAADGVVAWRDLPSGRYGVRAIVLAEGYDRFYVPGRPGIGGEPEAGFKAAGEQGSLVELAAGAAETQIRVYAMARGERAREREKPADETGGVRNVGEPAATPQAAAEPGAEPTPVTKRAVARPRNGSLTVRVLSCPDPFETWNPATCVIANPPYDFAVYGEDGTVYSLADAVSGGGGNWTWDGLPFGSYVLQQPVIAPGSGTYYVAGAQYLETGGYLTGIDEANPAAALDVFNLLPSLPPAMLPPPDPALLLPAPPVEVAPPPVEVAPPPVEVAPPPVEAAPPAEPQPAEAPPPDPDTDGDGLPDGYEDGVIGTNPGLYDSDGDGLGDGEEVNLGLGNPLVPDAGGGAGAG
ncbi:MAG: hypothetical protein ACKOWF_03875, partial [Chloroflexota bacterium]